MTNAKYIISLAILQLVAFKLTAAVLIRCPVPPNCDAIFCPTGAVQYGYDLNGCQTCECLDPCAAVQCERGEVCTLQWPNCLVAKPCYPYAVCIPQDCKPCPFKIICEYGIRSDCNGCDACCCNDDPCVNVECPKGFNCKGDSSGAHCV